MNKYFILILIALFVVGSGFVYRLFFLPEASRPVVTGKVRDITVIARKDAWLFDPEIVDAVRGDTIVMTIINEDDYDHGIAIDAFGVSQRMPAKGTIKIQFDVTQEGEFPFYCSVPCGEGEYEGKKRGHFDMVGKLHVRSIVSETR